MGPNWKPAKGTFKKERRAKQARVDREERARKQQSKERDEFRCRWPRCHCGNRVAENVESAHLEHKGIGGDAQLIRTTVDKLITLCPVQHRGPRGFDQGWLDIVPLTDAGTSGPCLYREKASDGSWTDVGRERAIHCLA